MRSSLKSLSEEAGFIVKNKHSKQYQKAEIFSERADKKTPKLKQPISQRLTVALTLQRQKSHLIGDLIDMGYIKRPNVSKKR